jgi:hypothetical protein
LNKILEKEVPEEPHGVPDEDAAGHHPWGGQPNKVPARGEVYPMDHFQSQNRINKVKPKYICGLNLYDRHYT